MSVRSTNQPRDGSLGGLPTEENRYAGTPLRNRKAGLWPWFMGVGAGGLLTLGVATVAIVLLGQQAPGSDSSQAQLAEHLPEWVPLYPGASLEESKLEQDGISGHFRFLAGSDTSGVLDWYDQQLETRGFTSVRYGVLEGQALRCTSQSQDRKVVITLRADGLGDQADVVFGRL